MSARACTNSHDSPYVFFFFFFFRLLSLFIPEHVHCLSPTPFIFPISLLMYVYDFSSLRASQLVSQEGTVLARSHPFCGVFWRASEVIPSFSP